MMLLQSISSFFKKFRGIGLIIFVFGLRHIYLRRIETWDEIGFYYFQKLLLCKFSLKSSQYAIESLILMSFNICIRKTSISIDRQNRLFEFWLIAQVKKNETFRSKAKPFGSNKAILRAVSKMSFAHCYAALICHKPNNVWKIRRNHDDTFNRNCTWFYKKKVVHQFSISKNGFPFEIEWFQNYFLVWCFLFTLVIFLFWLFVST